MSMSMAVLSAGSNSAKPVPDRVMVAMLVIEARAPGSSVPVTVYTIELPFGRLTVSTSGPANGPVVSDELAPPLGVSCVRSDLAAIST